MKWEKPRAAIHLVAEDDAEEERSIIQQSLPRTKSPVRLAPSAALRKRRALGLPARKVARPLKNPRILCSSMRIVCLAKEAKVCHRLLPPLSHWKKKPIVNALGLIAADTKQGTAAERQRARVATRKRGTVRELARIPVGPNLGAVAWRRNSRRPKNTTGDPCIVEGAPRLRKEP
jgi:hypothetical protein